MLELSLKLEVLRFRAVPPPRETTKGKDIKPKRFFYLVNLCFVLFHFAFFLFFLFCIYSLHCFCYCVLFTLCCYYLWWCVVPHLVLLLLDVVHHFVLLLFVVVHHLVLLLVVVCHFAMLLIAAIHPLVLLLLVVLHFYCLMLLLFIVVHHLGLVLLLSHSTPFLGIHDLTLPCVAPPCYGLSSFALHYSYLLIQVMYSPHLLAMCRL